MSERKRCFKLPPQAIMDPASKQEARRSKALEEQRLRRTQKFDSARQLDFFADLTLSDEDEDDEPATLAPSTGVASFVSVMKEHVDVVDSQLVTAPSMDSKGTGKKKKRKRGGRASKKPSKWADKCMYAELLEMVDPGDSVFNNTGDLIDGNADIPDGLPTDLETGWVSVGPVPVGKRCLAVTFQSSGVVGVAPNTTLRSRVLGKSLITRFPSVLPPSTILDCILDVNWKDNGILHVLDVIKWKGQDVGDCEARFRFWWRDTRLAEIAQSTPSVGGYRATIPLPMVSLPAQPACSLTNLSKYRFTYPMTFLPIPYFTDTSLSFLHEHVIPGARQTREVTINVPVLNSISHMSPTVDGEDRGGMDVDAQSHDPSSYRMHSMSLPTNACTQVSVLPTTSVASVPIYASIQSDGLLLYVAEASYESGTSPLSNWIPIVGYERNAKAGEAKGEVKRAEGCPDWATGPLKRISKGMTGPLDLFEQLVARKLEQRLLVSCEGRMDMES